MKPTVRFLAGFVASRALYQAFTFHLAVLGQFLPRRWHEFLTSVLGTATADGTFDAAIRAASSCLAASFAVAFLAVAAWLTERGEPGASEMPDGNNPAPLRLVWFSLGLQGVAALTSTVQTILLG